MSLAPLQWFRFGPLVVTSRIALPGLRRAVRTSCADWRIVRGPQRLPVRGPWTQTWYLPGSRAVWGRVGRLADRRHLIVVTGVGQFVVNAATRTIAWRPIRGVSADIVGSLLVSQVLPYAASSHDLVLHAGAVDTPDGAVLLIGPTGVGKSTIATWAARQPEHRLIADDAVVLRRRGRAWFCVPEPGSIRLRRDVIGVLPVGSAAARSTHPANGKTVIDVAGAGFARALRPRRVTAACLLERARRTDSSRVMPVRTAEAVVRLVQSQFALALDEPAILRENFDRLTGLVRGLPVVSVSVPRRTDGVSEVWRAIAGSLPSMLHRRNSRDTI